MPQCIGSSTWKRPGRGASWYRSVGRDLTSDRSDLQRSSTYLASIDSTQSQAVEQFRRPLDLASSPHRCPLQHTAQAGFRIKKIVPPLQQAQEDPNDQLPI